MRRFEDEVLLAWMMLPWVFWTEMTKASWRAWRAEEMRKLMGG